MTSKRLTLRAATIAAAAVTLAVAAAPLAAAAPARDRVPVDPFRVTLTSTCDWAGDRTGTSTLTMNFLVTPSDDLIPRVKATGWSLAEDSPEASGDVLYTIGSGKRTLAAGHLRGAKTANGSLTTNVKDFDFPYTLRAPGRTTTECTGTLIFPVR